MTARYALAALLVVAIPAAATIAPVEERTYRLVTSTERDDGRAVHRFSMVRDIVFTREPAGFLARVTMRAGSGDKDGASGLYARALSALAGETIRFHLGPDGRVIAIDDLDAAWERLAVAINAMAPTPAAGSATARRMGDLLRALPTEKRQAMLASIIAPLSQPLPAIGSRTATFTAEGIDGHSVSLSGQQTVTRLPSGLVQVAQTAQDTPSSPAVSLKSDRTFDPRSGLLVDAVERRTLRLPADAGRALVVTDHTSFTPLVL